MQEFFSFSLSYQIHVEPLALVIVLIDLFLSQTSYLTYFIGAAKQVISQSLCDFKKRLIEH